MGEIALTAGLFAMLGALLWLANTADRRRDSAESSTPLTIATFVILGVVFAAMLGLGGLLVGIGLLSRLGGGQGILALGGEQVSPTQIEGSLYGLGFALAIPALAALLLLLPATRRWLARLIPIDPTRATHAVALAYAMLVPAYMGMTLAIGLETLAAAFEATVSVGASRTMLWAIWAQDIGLLLLSMVGVGWYSRRNLGQVLVRLGIAVPTARQVAVGIGIGLAVVPVVTALEALPSAIGLSQNPAADRLSEALLGPLMRTIPGILTLGLAAAMGEEALFRGALQPRFGIVLTSLLFTLLHSNYGLGFTTVLLFMMSILLGWVRNRVNTSTSMVVHAVYNMATGLIAYAGL